MPFMGAGESLAFLFRRVGFQLSAHVRVLPGKYRGPLAGEIAPTGLHFQSALFLDGFMGSYPVNAVVENFVLSHYASPGRQLKPETNHSGHDFTGAGGGRLLVGRIKFRMAEDPVYLTVKNI